MKKNIILIICLFLFFPSLVFARGDISSNKSSITLESGTSETFVVTANNSAGKVTFSSSNNSVASVDKSAEWLDNSSVTVTVTANSTGTATISIGIDAATYDEEELKETKTISITVRPPKSGNNNLSDLKVNGSTVSGFSSSKTSYTLARTNDTSIDISASTEDNKASLKGTGKKNLDYGDNTFNVIVTAENGSTKTYKINVERIDNRSSDNYLSSLKVSGVDLKFNKNTTEYSFTVEHSLESVSISATANDSKSSVSGTGNKKLDDYDNTFNVTVTAENGSKRTYKIIIKRKNAQGALHVLSGNNNINNLGITGYNLDFNSNKDTYYLEVGSDVNNLDLKVDLADSTAKYEVLNNSNFDKNINTVEIVVTSENGETKKYTINVLKKELGEKKEEDEKPIEEPKKEEDKKEEDKKGINIFMIIAIVEFIFIIVYIIATRKKKTVPTETTPNNENLIAAPVAETTVSEVSVDQTPTTEVPVEVPAEPTEVTVPVEPTPAPAPVEVIPVEPVVSSEN